MPETGSTLLRLHHLSTDELGLPPSEGNWLGGAWFGAGHSAENMDGMPLAHVQLSPLNQAGEIGQGVAEAWAVAGPLHQGRHEELHWRCNESWWFGAVEVEERILRDSAEFGTPLQQAVRRAYTLLFEALRQQGALNLVRAWNHIADINRENSGLERYRQFNIARQEVFLSHGRSVEGGSVPAASALGAAAGAPFVLYALASRQPVRAIENPRQISAYCYPDNYGPRSPTFSRAALSRQSSALPLFISGTASIVGHQSLHEGNVIEQTRETLRNLQAVLDQTRREADGLTLDTLSYKVYVRHAADWPKVEAELHKTVGMQVPVLALQADVCRSDLLVEIEAVGYGQPITVPA